MGNNYGTHPPLLSRHLTLQNLRNTIFLGVAHTIFLGVAHTIFFGSGAHDMFWEWRARYVFGVAHTIFFGVVPELGS